MKFIFAVLLGSWVTLVAGLVLLQQQAIRDWLRKHRVHLSALSDAAPPNARPWMVTGWALAGGIGFGILLPNITELFGTHEQAVTLGTVVVFLIPCTVLTVYFLHLRRQTLVLEHLWSVLAWVHYRPILSGLLSRSRARLDFITHRGADLRERLVHTGVKELAFRLVDDVTLPRPGPTPDLIIADLDILESIEQAIALGETGSRLLPLKEWQLGMLLDDVFQSLPGSQDTSSAKYLPIRWGFNSLSVLTASRELRTSFYETPVAQLPPVDVATFLADPLQTPVAPLWSDGGFPLLLVLDWYLPNMAVLALSIEGRAAWSEADENQVNSVRKALATLKTLLQKSATANNLPLSELLCPDVVTLQRHALSAKSAIVFVGGNFLWCERSPALNPDNVFQFPFLIEGEPRCLWWQECLYVPFSGPLRGGQSGWRSELPRIVSHLNTELSALNGLMPFHGYLPNSSRSGFEDHPKHASVAEDWKNFAQKRAFARSTHARADEVWSKLWVEWREGFAE